MNWIQVLFLPNPTITKHEALGHTLVGFIDDGLLSADLCGLRTTTDDLQLRVIQVLVCGPHAGHAT